MFRSWYDRGAIWTVDHSWFGLVVVTLMTLASFWGYRDPQGPRRWWNLLRGGAVETPGDATAGTATPATRSPNVTALNVARGDVVLVVESPRIFTPRGAEAMRAVVDALESLDYVKRVLWMDRLPPLNVFGLPEPLLPKSSASEQRFAAAREKALRHPLVVGQLLSPDGQTAVLLLTLDWMFVREDRDCMERLLEVARAAASPYAGEGLVFSVTGSVPIRLTASQQNEANQVKYQVIGYTMIVLMSLILFRGFAAVLIVAVATVLGVLWTLGLLRFFELQDNPFNDVVLPVLLSLVGLTDSVHLLVHIRRYRAAGLASLDAARRGVKEVGLACFLTSLTTAIGFGSLGLAEHDVVKEFGWSSVLGVTCTFVSVMVVVPLACRTWLGTHVHAGQERSLVDRHLSRVEMVIDKVLRHARGIAWGGLVLTAVLVAFGLTLRPDQRSSSILPENSEPAVALRKLDAALGGLESGRVEVRWSDAVPADSPEVLQVIREVDQTLLGEPLVGHPLSLRNLLDALPGEGDSVDRMSMLDLLPAPLKRAYYSPENREASVQFRVQDLGIARYGPVFERIQKQLAEVVARHPQFTATLAGSAVWRWENLYQIVVDLVSSLGSAALIIFGVLGIAYRSVRLGLISVLPNVFPLAVAAALMAWTGQSLEVVSVCCFTICLGIAVDDTIHFLTRYQEECRTAASREEAIRKSFSSAGTGMIMTTLILVAGFCTVLFSGLREHQIFARMGAIMIAAALLGDLIILPALLACYGPQPQRDEPDPEEAVAEK